MKAKKMDNLAEQAIKTDTVVGGSKGASQTPTPRPDPSLINNQISQDRSLQEPLGAIDEPRSRIGSSSNTTAATKGTL